MTVFRKINTFGKVVTLLCLLLIPIIALYAYSHQVSVNVVRSNIEAENRNHLTFFMSQMESEVERLGKFSVIGTRYSGIKEFLAERNLMSPVEQLQKQTRILELLNLQILTSGWNNQIALYLQDTKEAISTDYSVLYDKTYLQTAKPGEWSHKVNVVYGSDQSYFSLIRQSDVPGLLIEVRFTDDNIKNMLKQLKQGGSGEPFLYFPGQEPVMNISPEHQVVKELAAYLNGRELSKSGSEIVTMDKKKYMVNFIRSESLQWYLVDYVPLESVLFPITMSRNLFYSSLALLLGLSILATLLLYRNVQRPIQMLVRGVRRLKGGQYSVRLEKQPNNEFDYLFASFNEMAERIQELIENVYAEKLRSSEAILKQLQSQINPHFLYNCLFYIKNMANLGQKDAVVAMALNLGEYYRSTIRIESGMTTIRDELKLVTNYLTIQNLRIQRFDYEIAIPEAMMELEIPRLLIQPIVENAVIHGIEANPDYGVIEIGGSRTGDEQYRIVIDDNGGGMSTEAMAALQKKLSLPMDDETGCGVWNVHQRLAHLYQGGSGVYLSRSPLGGLRVELRWDAGARQTAGGERHVPFALG
ncbi:histidine kinase [Paenibacillus hamazuiensis]|uniref:histidine kinase n=1 Tax=Paenibacillus hamazuiensis TaxID=2936508 RepID=UPI00200DDAD2|nr:histidine kinase [Paenibacillus hamazuiensis]